MFKFIAKLFRRRQRIAWQPVNAPDPETQIIAVTQPDGRIEHVDRRNLDKMTFGLNEPTEVRRESVARTVRSLLRKCGVKVGGDIATLGCTGVFKSLSVHGFGDMNGVQAGMFLREGLAGSGVGLACFVGPNRFCLIHNTIGGLQPGQEAHHVEVAPVISRRLTRAEEGKVRLVEQGRRMYARGNANDAAAMLSGFDREAVKAALGGEIVEEDTPDLLPGAAWRCEEHRVFVEGCRYCLAGKIVHEGPLTTTEGK